MFEVIGAAPGSESTQDRPAIWKDSVEHEAVKAELARMKETKPQQPIAFDDPDELRPYAASFAAQFWIVLVRVFQQYWRTPSYLYSKIALCLFSALFIGFSFWKMPNSLQGLQNQLYAIFMLFTIFGNFCTQILPHFATQRTLYEARECPSKTYSWKVFILSNILVEISWNSLMAVLIFLAWYYPIGLRQNAVEADKVAEREALMFLFILAILIFAGTFSDMCVAAVDTAEAAGNIANLLFPRTLIFCGYVKSPLSLPFYLQPLQLPPHPRNIFEKPLLTQPPNVLATPTTLPGSWIFMYRVPPLTYLVSGILSVGLANSHIACTTEEFLHFCSPLLSNCSTYLAPYIERFGGSFVPDSMNSTTECVFCIGSDTNIFLESVSAKYADRWRNFVIIWVYVGFNAAAAVGLYWLARVPKGRREKK